MGQVRKIVVAWLLLLSESVVVEGGIHCNDPIDEGELRYRLSKECLSVHSEPDPTSTLKTAPCSGSQKQSFIRCSDGTIRSGQYPHLCLTPDPEVDDVAAASCQVYPRVPDSQLWDWRVAANFTDIGGVMQTAFTISNRASGFHLKASDLGFLWSDSSVNLTLLEGQFYFRSRGKLLAHGRLLNEREDLCLDASGFDGARLTRMQINVCEDSLDHYYSYYENGELVNEKSGLCVENMNEVQEGRYHFVTLNHCREDLSQMWLRPEEYCVGDYCAFVNRARHVCLDALHRVSDRLAKQNPCNGTPGQRFKFVPDKWDRPTAKWTLVGCNQNGGITHSIADEVSYAREVTRAMAVEVGAKIKTEVVFASASLHATTSTSLGKTWTETRTGKKAIEFSCEHYDSGAEFRGGCMWQLEVETRETLAAFGPLRWRPQIVKCSSNQTRPLCPPFTRCKDDGCGQCV